LIILVQGFAAKNERAKFDPKRLRKEWTISDVLILFLRQSQAKSPAIALHAFGRKLLRGWVNSYPKWSRKKQISVTVLWQVSPML